MGHYQSNKRWRQKNPHLWQQQKSRNYDRGAQDDRSSGLSYTPQQDRLILNFKGTDRQLAKKMGRTVRAIQIRRSRLRKSQH